HVISAPTVLEYSRRLGPCDARLRHLRGGRPHSRELYGPGGAEVPIGIERRPLAELCRIGQGLPDLHCRMMQLPHEHERPRVPILSDLSASSSARCIPLTNAHRFLRFLGDSCFVRSRWRSSASTWADQKRRKGASQASTSMSASGLIR